MQVIMYQANAFTDKLFEGSPIGIVPDSKDLRLEDMKRIVQITNLNKVAFITDKETGCYNLRFFNSEEEISSCDCATVASFYALAERGYIKGVEDGVVRVYECTQVGKRAIDVYFKDCRVDRVELCEQYPISICENVDIELISKALNIKDVDIGSSEVELRPEIMFKRSKDLIVPIKTDEILDSIVIDIEMIKSNPLTEDVDKLFVFSIDEEEIINYICFELSTIETCANEDNTSGLLYYIKKNNLLDKEHFIYKDKSLKTKHSHMHCEIIENKDGFPIKIGGKASIYLEGVVTYG